MPLELLLVQLLLLQPLPVQLLLIQLLLEELFFVQLLPVQLHLAQLLLELFSPSIPGVTILLLRRPGHVDPAESVRPGEQHIPRAPGGITRN